MSHIENILIYCLIATLAVVMVFFLFKKHKGDFLKWFLNVLLLISILPLVFTFRFQPPQSQSWIIYDEKVDDYLLRKIRDSLNIGEALKLKDFKMLKRSNSINVPEDIFLVGSQFEVEDIAALAGKNLNYIADYKVDSLRDLRWRGVLSPYQNQEISGKIYTEKSKWVKARYGNTTLDSILVNGLSEFQLNFAGFGAGKVQVDLYVESQYVHTCKFFVQKPKALKVLVLNESADFETKTLATWLAKQGHKVLIKNTIAKDAAQQLALNAPGGSDFDWVVSPVSQLSATAVKKAVNDKKSILIIGAKKSDQNQLNKFFDINVQFKFDGTGEEQELVPGLFVHPVKISNYYRISQNFKYPIFFISPHSVISFVSESYPLMLSGDSLKYGEVWQNALGYLYQDGSDRYTFQQPILKNENADYQISTVKDLNVLKRHPLKSGNYLANFQASQTGWQVLNDSTEVFVSEPHTSWMRAAQIQKWVIAYSSKNGSSPWVSNTHDIPNTLKWILPFAILILLWLEPK